MQLVLQRGLWYVVYVGSVLGHVAGRVQGATWSWVHNSTAAMDLVGGQPMSVQQELPSYA